MQAKNFEDAKYQVSSRVAQSMLKLDWRKKLFQSQYLGRFFYHCVNFSTGSYPVIHSSASLYWCMDHLKDERLWADVVKTMVEVAAWLTGHFKAKNFKPKNKAVKVDILEVGKAKTCCWWQTISHYGTYLCSKAHFIQRIILTRIYFREIKNLYTLRNHIWKNVMVKLYID